MSICTIKEESTSPAGGRLSDTLSRKEKLCIAGRTLFFAGVSMQLPYFKFMVNDYLSGKIQACSFSTQGLFINIISMIWKDKGLLQVDKAMLCRILRATESELDAAITELQKYDIITIGEDGKMTVKFISEQMEELTEAHNRRQLAGMQGGRGNKKSNALQSESDTESDIRSKKLESKGGLSETSNHPLNPKVDDIASFIEELKNLYPSVDVDAQIRHMKAWLLTPKGKGRRLTKRFAVNWLTRADVPIDVPSIPEQPKPATMWELTQKKKIIVDKIKTGQHYGEAMAKLRTELEAINKRMEEV